MDNTPDQELTADEVAAAAAAAQAVTGKHVCLLTPDVQALKAALAKVVEDLNAVLPVLQTDVAALKTDVAGVVSALKAVGGDIKIDASNALSVLETKVSALAASLEQHFGIKL